jgi:hypothetical protein
VVAGRRGGRFRDGRAGARRHGDGLEDRTDLAPRDYASTMVPVDEDGHYRLLSPARAYRVRALAPWPCLADRPSSQLARHIATSTSRSIRWCGSRPADGALGPAGSPGAGFLESSGGRVQSIHSRRRRPLPPRPVEPDVESLWARRGELMAAPRSGALRTGARPVIMARGRGVHGRILAPDGQPLGGVEVIARESPALAHRAPGRGGVRALGRRRPLPPRRPAARSPGPRGPRAGPGTGHRQRRRRRRHRRSEHARRGRRDRTGAPGRRRARGRRAGDGRPGCARSEPYRHLLSRRRRRLPARGAGRPAGCGSWCSPAVRWAPPPWEAATRASYRRPDPRPRRLALRPAHPPRRQPAPAAPVEAATGLPTAGFGFYAAGVSDARGPLPPRPLRSRPVSVTPLGRPPATAAIARRARSSCARPDGALVLTAAGGSDR